MSEQVKQTTWLQENESVFLPTAPIGWKVEIAAIRAGKVLVISTPIRERPEKPLTHDVRKR